MIATDRLSKVLQGIEGLRPLCPDMRLGQILATVGMLGEDTTGKTLWELEDDELLAAVERFADDLARRVGSS